MTSVHDILTSPLRFRRAKRRRSGKTLHFHLREIGPVWSLRLGEILLFFFLSLSECFHLPSPFAVCALCAYLLDGRKLLCPAIGLALSLSLRLLWQVEIDAMQYVACALLLILRFKPPYATWCAAAYAACVLSLRIFVCIFVPATQQTLILATVSLLVGALCTPAFCHVIALHRQPYARMRMDDLLCCLVLAAVMLSGAGRVAVGPVNIGFTLCGFAILLCASVTGCTSAVCTGLISGISLALCGHPDSYVVCYAFSGIVCGLFYGRKRPVLCIAYLLCCVFTSYAVRFSLDIPFLLSALASCLAFLCIPRRSVTTAYTLVRRLSPDASDNEAAYAQFTRAQWTANLLRLSQLLPEVRLPLPNDDEQLEHIRERMCSGCDRQMECWQTRTEETQSLLREYFLQGNRAARIPDCPHLAAWPSLALDCERSEHQRSLRCAYAMREREATRTHLSAIAQAMSRISKEGAACDRDDDMLLGEAAYLLRRMRISGRLIYALRVNQHISIALRYEPQITRQRQLERYCEELSRALNTPLHIANHSKDMILIEETPPLMVECYHLSASAGNGHGANGDSVLLRSIPGGMELCMLSDGMGHGENAHEESEKTLELLSLCVDSGYTIPSALDAINCIMLSSTDGEQYATVDLCVCDLWHGHITLDKLGACPSILISGEHMRVLESSALPLGILPSVKSSTHTLTVSDGDLLIQFTDGLSDACGGMRQLENQVQLLMHDRLQRAPEAICSALISAAMRRSGGVPKDDMTVLCTLFKKRKNKKREETFPQDSVH